MWTEPMSLLAVLSGNGAYERWHYIDWTGMPYEGELSPFGPLEPVAAEPEAMADEAAQETEAAPACDLPDTTWRFYNTGAGQLSGIGEVDLFTTHCTIFDAESGGADSTSYHRTPMFTTADGDTLAVVHQIPSTEVFADDPGNLTGFTLQGTWEAVGGTGRFTHAAESGSMDAAADIPGDIVLNFAGEITLHAPEPPAESPHRAASACRARHRFTTLPRSPSTQARLSPQTVTVSRPE